MRCLKLPGERVTARDFDCQVAGLPIRAAILNRIMAPGTPRTRRVGSLCEREGEARPQADMQQGQADLEAVPRGLLKQALF